MSKITRLVRHLAVVAIASLCAQCAWAALPVPMAHWTTLAANAKGGAEGTDGAKFTMVAGSGGSFANGVGKTTKQGNGGTANEGIKITWDANAYTGRSLSILIKYSGYDCSNLGNNSFIATMWGTNEEVVYANGGGSNVGLSANVTSNANNGGGSQNMTSPTYAMPAAGYVLVSMNRDEGDNTGTRLSFAPSASFPEFTSVAYQSGHKYAASNFAGIKIGGTQATIGKYHRPAVTIEEVLLFDQVVTPEVATQELLNLTAIPTLLANIKPSSGTDADGWLNVSPADSPNTANFPADNSIVRAKITCGGGNFKTSFFAAAENDFQSGSYKDVTGASHETIGEEIAATLNLPSAVTSDVYNTGTIQGARNDGALTISGLKAGQKYIVYAGFGHQTKTSGITLNTSGFGNVDAAEYVATVASESGHTTVATEYQTFTTGQALNAGANGLMIVRLKGITPNASNNIVISLAGETNSFSGLNFLAVAQMNADKLTATVGADVALADIAWEGGLTWKDGVAAVITVTADCEIAVGDAAPEYLELDGVGKTVTIKCTKDNLPAIRGTATVKYLYDATDAAIELSSATLTAIRTSGNTYIFKGTADNGVTLNYGASTGAEMKSHLIFESGTHAMTYGNDNSKLFATGHSNTDPTILIKNGATLDLTAKDLSGWSGGANVTGVIRVNKGGTLNILESETTTFFYRQRLLLEPGSLVAYDFGRNTDADEGQFRWHGGTGKDTAQIYMMDYDQDKSSDPAIIRQIGDSEFLLASDNTRGLAVYVGRNAKLKMEANVRVKLANNNAALAKYGEGELVLAKGATLYDLNVAEGKVSLDETENTVTINNSCTGTGTLEFNKAEVSLGQSYRTMKLVFAAESTVKVIASGAEKADGAVVLKTAMSSIEGLTFVVDDNEVDSDDVVLDTEAGTITLKLATQSVKTTSNVSGWESSWTGTVSVKNDDSANAITMTVDAAFPAGVTTVNVFGKVDIVYAEGASEEQSVTIAPQSGAAVSVTGAIANTIAVPSGVTLITKGETTSAGKISNSGTVEVANGTLTLSAGTLGGTITIDKGATIKFGKDHAIGNTVVLNVYGTLDLTGATWFDSNSAPGNVLNLFAGSKIVGGNCGMVVTGGYSNTINIKQYADADVNYVDFGVTYHTSSYGAGYSTTFVIENDASKPKVGLKITKPFQRNGQVFVTGSHIQGLYLDCSKEVKLGNNNRCLHGDITIKSGTTLVMQAGDMIPYQATNDFVLNLEGTLACGTTRQTLSAEGGNNVVNLNGGTISGTGAANGGYTSILDVFQDQLITLSGTSTISGPIGFRNATTTTLQAAEGAETAVLKLTGGVVGNANAKIKLMEGTSLVAEIAADKVISGVTGKVVVGNGSAETPYTLADLVTITIPTVANTTITKVMAGETEVSVVDGAITVAPGTEVTITYTADAGYVGGGDVTVTIESAETTITPPAAPTPAPITFTITAIPEHTVAYVQIDGGAATEVVDGQFTAVPGNKLVVWFMPADGYTGNTQNTGVVTVVYPMAQTTIQAPTAEEMDIKKVVAVAVWDDNDYEEFASITEAIAAGDGATITLLDDLELGSAAPITIPSGVEIAINFNGHTISRTTSSNYVLDIVNGASVILADVSDAGNGGMKGTPVASGNTKNPASLIRNKGGLLIMSGVYQSDYTVVKNDEDPGKGVLIVEGGTLEIIPNDKGYTGLTFAIMNWTDATITGGTFNGNVQALSYNGNAVCKASTMTINGGTFVVPPTVYMIAYDTVQTPTITVKDGVEIAVVNASDTSLDLEVKQNGNVYTLAPIPYVAQIGEDKYLTLAEAIAQGGEIVLLADIELTGANDAVVIPATFKGAIDFGTHTISRTANSYYVMDIDAGAELTLKGATGGMKGTPVASGNTKNPASLIRNKGTLTIESGVYQSDYTVVKNDEDPGKGVLIVDGGTLEIVSNDKGYTGLTFAIMNWTDATINGGTFNGNVQALSYNGNSVCKASTMTINGGTFVVPPTVYMIAYDKVQTPTITVKDGVEIAVVNASDTSLDLEVKQNGNVYTLGAKVTGPTSWTDVKEDTPVADVVPETIKETIAASNVKATDIKTWATTHGVDIAHGDISVNALIFNVAPSAAPDTEAAAEEAAAEVLEELATKIDLAEVMQTIGENGLMITSLSTEYPMATIKLVPSTKLESTGTAKFFQLSIELK